MIDFKPFRDDFGEFSVLYGEIGFMIKSLGLYVGCDDSAGTLQFYGCEDKFNKQKHPWGAIQYEQNNKKINFRFYRKNIPTSLKEKLESLPTKYRQDTNDIKCNPNALSIAFKFSSLEKGVHSFVLEIYRVLEKEIQNNR